MFVDEDHDALLAAIMDLKPEYYEYVIEVTEKGIVQIRGICMFPNAKSHCIIDKFLGKWGWSPKPLNMKWDSMYDSFNQSSTKSTIITHVIDGRRPVGQGARTDLKPGEYAYLPDCTADNDDCLLLPPPSKLARSASEY